MAEIGADGSGAVRSTVVGLLRVAEALRPTAILDVCLALVLLPVLMPAGTVLLVGALEVNGVAGAGGPFIESETAETDAGPVAVVEGNGAGASKRGESTGFLPLLLPPLPSPLPDVPLSLHLSA